MLLGADADARDARLNAAIARIDKLEGLKWGPLRSFLRRIGIGKHKEQ